MMSLLPDTLIAFMALLAICAMIMGFKKWIWTLAGLAVLRWLIWPVLAPSLKATLNEMSVGGFVLALPVLCLAMILLGLRALQGVLSAIYGRHVSARVTAHAINGTFVLLGRLIRAPFAAQRHRANRNMRGNFSKGRKG